VGKAVVLYDNVCVVGHRYVRGVKQWAATDPTVTAARATLALHGGRLALEATRWGQAVPVAMGEMWQETRAGVVPLLQATGTLEAMTRAQAGLSQFSARHKLDAVPAIALEAVARARTRLAGLHAAGKLAAAVSAVVPMSRPATDTTPATAPATAEVVPDIMGVVPFASAASQPTATSLGFGLVSLSLTLLALGAALVGAAYATLMSLPVETVERLLEMSPQPVRRLLSPRLTRSMAASAKKSGPVLKAARPRRSDLPRKRLY